MKKILIVPRHTGVNTMPWAWMLSRSADFYSVTLPPPQFMPVSEGAAGYYPEITQDFFYAHFRAYVEDLNLGESIRVLQDIQECIWDNDKQIEDAFANFIKLLNESNYPGVVICPPTWRFADKYIKLAESTTTADVKTVLVKSNLRTDVKQRWFFLYDAFPDDAENWQDRADDQMLDLVNAEMKQSKHAWNVSVNAEDVSKLDIIKTIYNELEIQLSEDTKEDSEQIQSYMDSLKQPANDPFESGVHNVDWDTWLNTKNPVEVKESNKQFSQLMVSSTTDIPDTDVL